MPKPEVNPELAETLLALTKRMQTGVAFVDQARYEQSGIHPVLAKELKDLRVGINVALSTNAAIADVLAEAGICTGDSYMRACIKRMQDEVDRYTEQIRKMHPGVNISLGEAGYFTPEKGKN